MGGRLPVCASGEGREDPSIDPNRPTAKGTGTLFGLGAWTRRDHRSGRKMSQSPAATKEGAQGEQLCTIATNRRPIFTYTASIPTDPRSGSCGGSARRSLLFDPVELYQRAMQRGMDFVTISDHNCIRGALEIAHLPGTFISNEVTTYFPEDGCKIHVLVFGIDERQFRAIQELREDIYQLHRYLVEENVLSAVAHPMYRVNGRLTIDHLEKLLLMFSRFEGINGARERRGADLVAAIFRNLTPELIARMADRHGMEPTGPEPWKKTFVGGSNDHSGAHVGTAHTMTPFAQDVAEFLAHLRHGEHEAAGFSGGSVLMGHSLYHIAYSYYKSRFLRGERNGKPTILGELFKHLLEAPKDPSEPAGFGQKLRGLASGVVRGRQLSKLNETERMLVSDFTQLFSAEQERSTASPLTEGRRTFHIACQISHFLGYSFFRRFLEFMRQGRLIESLQTVASLGPVALGIAPYLAAFSTQHKDAGFLNAVAAHFDLPVLPTRKAWLTDTYAEVNGVTRTIQALGAAAQGGPASHGHHLPGSSASYRRRREELPARRHIPDAGVRVAIAFLPSVS